MKSLKTLIRLNKDKLDKLLTEISKQEIQKTDLKVSREKIISEAKLETDKYFGTEYAYMLDKYLERSREQQHHLTLQIQNLELQIIRLRSDLTNQFAELKKYEIALERKKQELAEKQKKAETKELDEFATGRFIYNQKDKLS